MAEMKRQQNLHHRIFINRYRYGKEKFLNTATLPKRRIKNLSFSLSAGQMGHVLRHTFASHFIQNGGNILVLQKTLGHGSILMTMRYAHLAPEHFEEAIKFNPIDKNGHFEKTQNIKPDKPLI